jgi:uncharacterized protein YkwD
MYKNLPVQITVIVIFMGILTVPSAALTQVHAQSNVNLESSLLNVQNQARAEVNVPALTWSTTLAADAQQWADQIASTGQPTHAQNTGQGENLAWGTKGAFTPEQLANTWIAEKANWHGGVLTPQNWYPTGHYTQVVWKDTTQVGCGLASDANQDYLVCRYSPPGNYMGQAPY